MFEVHKCGPEGIIRIKPQIHIDSRGAFTERFNAGAFEALGLKSGFVQDNFSVSLPGVVRGIHFQAFPPQGKLVTCLQGRIWDVVVDLRKSSPGFGHWYGQELTAEDCEWIWIPEGFGHGFSVLGEKEAHVWYKVSSFYNPEGESGIIFDDADLGVDWRAPKTPILSKRDLSLPTFKKFSQSLGLA